MDKTKARYIITDIVNKDLEHHLLDNYTEWTKAIAIANNNNKQ